MENLLDINNLHNIYDKFDLKILNSYKAYIKTLKNVASVHVKFSKINSKISEVNDRYVLDVITKKRKKYRFYLDREKQKLYWLSDGIPFSLSDCGWDSQLPNKEYWRDCKLFLFDKEY